MDNFGLSILISVQDMASRSLGTIAQAFTDTRGTIQGFAQNLSGDTTSIESNLARLNSAMVAGMSAQQLGSSFKNASSSMINPLKQITTEVINTSAQFEDWRVTLDALYKDVEVAQEKLQWGMNLAAKTPFEIGTVTQALIGFKAIGVDADQQFKNANGEMRSLLEYVGDLGALRPDVGLEGVMLGIRNLIGGDGGKSLKMRMDMDFEQMLGRKWGDTKEQMMQDVVEVSDMIANGLMTKMEGTWNQVISNLEDQKTRLFKAMGDAGIFDAVKNSLVKFANVINGVDDEKLAKIGKNLKDSFSVIWKPIDLVVGALSKFAGVLINILSKNSVLSTFLATFLAIGGVLTGVVGALLTLGGSILQTVATLGVFYLTMLQNGVQAAALGGKILALLGVMGKLALIGGTVAIAWKSDFLGLRSTFTSFKNTVSDAFTHSRDIANYSVSEMVRVLGNLDMNTFGGRLRFRLVQLRVFFMALVDAWNDNTLSGDMFEKVQALGLLPLINTILDVKMYFEAFCEGVKKGFKEVTDIAKQIFDTIGEVLNKIGSLFKPTLKEIDNVKNSMGKGIDTTMWEEIGRMVGIVGTVFLAVFPIIKIVGGAFSFLTGVIGKVISIGGFVVGIFSKIFSVGGTLVGILFKVVSAFVGFAVANPILTAIIAVVGALVAAGIWLYQNWDMVKTNVSNALQNMANKASEIFNNIKASVDTFIANAKAKVSEGFQNLVTSAGEKLSSLKETVSNAFDNVKTAISDSLSNAWSTATEWWNKIKNIFSNPIKATVNLVKNGLGKDGSHYNGLSYVPFDGYVAELHKGERVLTASENKTYTKEQRGNSRILEPSDYSRLKTNSGGVSNNNTTNDNSVVFNEGAIQINVAQGTEQDAKSLAKTIMAEIEKQSRLRKTLSYRTV